MTDLVSQLVAQLEDMRGKVIELCQTYGNALPHGSLERTDAALTAAKAGGWVAVPVEPTPEMIREVEHAARLGAVWTAASVYKAMLSARPTTPPKEQS